MNSRLNQIMKLRLVLFFSHFHSSYLLSFLKEKEMKFRDERRKKKRIREKEMISKLNPIMKLRLIQQ